LRPEERGRTNAREERFGPAWIDGQRPDLEPIHGGLEVLPVFAAIFRSVAAAVRAGVEDAAGARVQRQRAHVALAEEPAAGAPEALPAVIAPPDALADRPHVNTRSIAGHSRSSFAPPRSA